MTKINNLIKNIVVDIIIITNVWRLSILIHINIFLV
jgi:hypothetical protein